jgi:hypothetical protein
LYRGCQHEHVFRWQARRGHRVRALSWPPASCRMLLLLPQPSVIRHGPALSGGAAGCRGMFAIFGVQGYLQELILQHTFENRFAFFVTALQCSTFAALATLQLQLATTPPAPPVTMGGKGSSGDGGAESEGGGGLPTAGPVPRRYLALLAVLQGVGMACTNSAVQRLNYPTKVVFKVGGGGSVPVAMTLQPTSRPTPRLCL